MKRLPGSVLVVLGVAGLLVSLSLVTWRQARAMDALRQLDELTREQSLARAEGEELARRIQVLESRGRVVPAARERLGLEIAPSTVLLVEGGA